MNADFSKRVLIADNETDTVESLKIVLSGYGYETLTAADGEEAIAVAKETSPDAIILDVAMPKVDGFIWTAEFSANGSAVLRFNLSSVSNPNMRPVLRFLRA
jgi:DNA-binding response OmpR family regulator